MAITCRRVVSRFLLQTSMNRGGAPGSATLTVAPAARLASRLERRTGCEDPGHLPAHSLGRNLRVHGAGALECFGLRCFSPVGFGDVSEASLTKEASESRGSRPYGLSHAEDRTTTSARLEAHVEAGASEELAGRYWGGGLQRRGLAPFQAIALPKAFV